MNYTTVTVLRREEPSQESTSVYAVIRNPAGKYWNRETQAWVDSPSHATRVFLKQATAERFEVQTRMPSGDGNTIEYVITVPYVGSV